MSKIFVLVLLVSSIFLSGCSILDSEGNDGPAVFESDFEQGGEIVAQRNAEQINTTDAENATLIDEEMGNETSNATDINIVKNQTDELNTTPDNMEMVFLDVGHGDSTLIKFGGEVILVDSGADTQTVALQLEELGVERIALFVISAWDNEKVLGVRSIMREFDVGEIWLSREIPANFLYDDIARFIEQREVLLHNPKAGDKREFGDMTIDVYNPQKDEYLDHADANAIVMKLSLGNFCVFLPSDLEHRLEPPIIGMLEDMECQIYKWRNHGEGRPEAPILFDRLSPKEVVISVGNNADKLPSSTTIQRIGIAGAGMYRTDIDGHIYVNASKEGAYAITPGLELVNITSYWNN